MKRGLNWKQGLAFAAGAFLVLGVSACSQKSETAAAPPAQVVDWPAFVQSFITSDFTFNPDFAIYEGKHEFDGKLPDWSEEGLQKQIASLKDWKTKAQAIDPAKLTKAQAFERDYLIAVIDGKLFWLDTADWPHKNPAFYGLDPNVYVARPYADVTTRMKAFTQYALAVPKAVEQIKANLRPPLPRSYIDNGVATFNGLAEYMKTDVKEAFKDGDAADKPAFDTAAAGAADAFTSLAKWLEDQRKTQTEGFAMGPDLFSKMLYETERVDTPLDQLEAIGRADLKRNQDALAEACSKFAPGKSIKDCVAKEAADKPEGGVVEYARKQLVELKQFVIDHNVATVPEGQEAKAEESPPYNRQNSAYIDPPGPYDKNLPAVYYISPPDPTWSKAKQNAYIPGKADLLFTSVHEVWPGHFLQFLHSNRSDSIFGQIYVGYAFAEGWAHYAEEMMWDEGLGDGDPETHVGQLLNALLRNVRFLSAIGMHTKGMTQAESEKMFLEDAYQDPGNAEQQAARGTYDPAYLNYTMGKLMIRKLRDDWCAAKGKSADDKTCWKDFHDAFLAYGGPPIPLIRGAMLNEKASAAF
ncbi:MAG: DUF885 family protein [Alphaproteobacteria bacterium]|nr:DUF885 family protein [Alphaproteobacteria bacterium]